MPCLRHACVVLVVKRCTSCAARLRRTDTACTAVRLYSDDTACFQPAGLGRDAKPCRGVRNRQAGAQAKGAFRVQMSGLAVTMVTPAARQAAHNPWPVCSLARLTHRYVQQPLMDCLPTMIAC
jgi:hypothetical protein